MKEILLVCIGSFFGGGARFLVSKALQSFVALSLPWGTMVVNVLGCFLIGLLSGWALNEQLSPTAKLVLVTGFCGGFTTFSTFMNENLLLSREGALLAAVLYTLGSMALGLLAVVLGYPDSQIMMLDKLFYDKRIERVHSCKGYSTFTDEIPRTY